MSGLDAENFNSDDFNYSQDHLRILSEEEASNDRKAASQPSASISMPVSFE